MRVQRKLFLERVCGRVLIEEDCLEKEEDSQMSHPFIIVLPAKPILCIVLNSSTTGSHRLCVWLCHMYCYLGVLWNAGTYIGLCYLKYVVLFSFELLDLCLLLFFAALLHWCVVSEYLWPGLGKFSLNLFFVFQTFTFSFHFLMMFLTVKSAVWNAERVLVAFSFMVEINHLHSDIIGQLFRGTQTTEEGLVSKGC